MYKGRAVVHIHIMEIFVGLLAEDELRCNHSNTTNRCGKASRYTTADAEEQRIWIYVQAIHPGKSSVIYAPVSLCHP